MKWKLSMYIIESNLTFIITCILQGLCLGGPTGCFSKKLHSAPKQIQTSWRTLLVN